MKLCPSQLKSNASSHDELTLGIDNHIITCSDYLKILGVNIDKAIDFSKHISDISVKCSQKVGVIMRLRKLKPTAAKLQLYKSAILPPLTYCHLVWNFCKALYNRRLQDIVVLMYKIKNNLASPHITDLFKQKAQRYHLRSADFDLARFRTVRYGKHSIRYFGPYLLSRLETHERESTNLKSFIANIKKNDLESMLEDGCKNCRLCSNYI